MPTPAMRVLTLALLFGVGLAQADEGVDRIVRKDGTIVQGRIQETGSEGYTVLLENGRVLVVPFSEVETLTRADPGPAVEEAEEVEEAEVVAESPPEVWERSGTEFGFEVGFVTGFRMRLDLGEELLDAVEIRAGLGVVQGEAAALVTVGGAELSLISDSKRHPTVGVLVGGGTDSLILLGGAGLIRDFGKVAHLQLGAKVGVSGSDLAWIPDVGFAFLW